MHLLTFIDYSSAEDINPISKSIFELSPDPTIFNKTIKAMR